MLLCQNPRQLSPMDNIYFICELWKTSFEICFTVRYLTLWGIKLCIRDVSMNRLTNLSNELRAASHIWPILHGSMSIVFFVGQSRDEMFHFVVWMSLLEILHLPMCVPQWRFAVLNGWLHWQRNHICTSIGDPLNSNVSRHLICFWVFTMD